MNNTYVFNYKKPYSLFWKKIKNTVGHNYDKEQNKMIVFTDVGHIYEIPDWSSCKLFLGNEWILYQKNDMEKVVGQKVKLNIKEKA